LKQQVEEWRTTQLSTAAAKLLIYQAFIEEETRLSQASGKTKAWPLLSASA
jgi:hypothetical protein